MRSRPPLAVLAMGLAITSCTSPDSAAVETLVSSTPTTPTTVATAAEGTAPEDGGAQALVVTVEVDGARSAAGSGASSTTASTATTGSTAATTNQPSTTANPTTTTVPPTTRPTTTPTTAAPTTSTRPPTTTTGTETRPELLRLALPTFGGGSFEPNSVAGKNVILWFWGAH